MEIDLVYEEGFNNQVKDFYMNEWPSANLEVFGFTEQSKWKMEEQLITAWSDGKIIGVAQFRIIGGVGYLGTLLVKEEYRGKGEVGINLLNKFENIAKSKGCHKLSLKSYLNSRAANFFKQNGYEIEGILKKDIHGIDWVYMSKF